MNPTQSMLAQIHLDFQSWLSFFFLAAGLSFSPTVDAQNRDFDLVKERVVSELMSDEVVDEKAQDMLARMQDDGSFRNINYADLSRTAGFPHRRHTSDLAYLARCYQQPSSSFYHDVKLKERIGTSLGHWVSHDYFGDNWHNNQISTPTNLVNLMLLIGDELPQDLVEKAQPIIGRAHMNASGARPSGDRIVIAGILAKNLLFVGDTSRFGEIINLIEGEVKFSTGKRGMQHDYSFHHRVDRVNNTTSYGYGKYANAFGEWADYVAKTRYAFSLEKINHLVDYYLDGIYPQMVYGTYTDISVKNRSIAHKGTFRPNGTREIERLLASTDHRQAELKEIMMLRQGQGKPTKSFCKFFWQTEHFVCQRPNYYTTVRMFSTRNRNMEVPYNGPGITTHHRADGTNYHMLKGDEYHNIWPVYDWQKISGATIMQKSELLSSDEIQKDGLRDFVGAVTDGFYGMVAFDFKSPHDLLEARKSWFFFKDEYLCLGAGIKSRPDLPVATTIDQRLLEDEVSIVKEGTRSVLPPDEHSLDGIRGIHHNRIGYILPTADGLRLTNREEQGRWSDITDQKHISEEVVKIDVFTLWFDHGESPDSATYEYIVIPDIASSDFAESLHDDRGIEILSNTADLQAAKNKEDGICQAAFYRAGKVQFSESLSVVLESQGMVMLQVGADGVEQLTVSDPSRKLNSLMLTISGKYQVKGTDASVLAATEGKTTLVVDLPQGVYAGKSVVIELVK